MAYTFMAAITWGGFQRFQPPRGQLWGFLWSLVMSSASKKIFGSQAQSWQAKKCNVVCKSSDEFHTFFSLLIDLVDDTVYRSVETWWAKGSSFTPEKPRLTLVEHRECHVQRLQRVEIHPFGGLRLHFSGLTILDNPGIHAATFIHVDYLSCPQGVTQHLQAKPQLGACCLEGAQPGRMVSVPMNSKQWCSQFSSVESFLGLLQSDLRSAAVTEAYWQAFGILRRSYEVTRWKSWWPPPYPQSIPLKRWALYTVGRVWGAWCGAGFGRARALSIGACHGVGRLRPTHQRGVGGWQWDECANVLIGLSIRGALAMRVGEANQICHISESLGTTAEDSPVLNNSQTVQNICFTTSPRPAPLDENA